MSAAQPERQSTEIKIVGEINTTIMYANYARVAVTPLDAIITFACIDPATASPGQEGQDVAPTVDAPVVARIALPHAVLKALADLIHDTLADREKREA